MILLTQSTDIFVNHSITKHQYGSFFSVWIAIILNIDSKKIDGKYRKTIDISALLPGSVKNALHFHPPKSKEPRKSKFFEYRLAYGSEKRMTKAAENRFL